MNYYEKALKVHRENKGKLEIRCKVPLETKENLSTVYTPGVAQPCKEIALNEEEAYKYTMKGNTVAVITDGSAVIGLGNIGDKAAIPVMEGKAALFKRFANIDAVPICIKTQDSEKFVDIVSNISATFGGINLEDISAPRCFEIEKKLQEKVDIPVFHDDQHGTGVVVTAAVINALKLVNKELKNIKIAVSGAGAAGTAIVRMLLNAGAENIVVSDINGILNREDRNLSKENMELAKITNPGLQKGKLNDAVRKADIFIGVSAPNIVTKEMISDMNERAIVFAMANPEPEIYPEEAKKGGAVIVGTGRSDFPNQINNVLAFPGIFRGALNVRAKRITEKMKVAAAYALANAIKDEELNEEYIIPDIFYPGISDIVARAVEEAWTEEK